jgi:hypothetical protein
MLAVRSVSLLSLAAALSIVVGCGAAYADDVTTVQSIHLSRLIAVACGLPVHPNMIKYEQMYAKYSPDEYAKGTELAETANDNYKKVFGDAYCPRVRGIYDSYMSGVPH